MPTTTTALAVCLTLTREVSRAESVEQIYSSALDALAAGLGATRAAVLLFDADGVMRFAASRGLSARYQAAVEGHSPWQADCRDAEPIVVADVTSAPSLREFLPAIEAEGIGAMAFIPLVSPNRVIGKFMVYFDTPHTMSGDEIQLAEIVAAQIAFAVERVRAEAQSRQSQEHLRFALDASAMGIWEWDLARDTVRWSDNVERIHGMAPGTFDGTFRGYEQEIHPDDRDYVLASVRKATTEGAPYDVEYRVVGQDGVVRWVEGKGHVEYEDGTAVRMTGVCMTVTRRKEAELARLADAEDASRMKDEFLATLSHELRTPLNAILGWVQMSQTGELSLPRARQALETVGRNARLQARLIEDILDVSRIIAGKLAIERGTVLVPQLLESVVDGLMPGVVAKRLELTTDIPGELPPLDGDPKRLHQVFSNVISNAIKFTPEGGHIHIAAQRDADLMQIRVRDSGVGIAPQFLPRIFDRFSQADSRATRAHGGLGLGLAIARHLTELHGGTLRAESAGVGLGTTVTITLECALPSNDLPPLLDGETDGVSSFLDGATVLVVDDDRDSRELLGILFEQCGAQVIECGGPDEALHAVRSREVTLLVADIGLPGMDGYELVRRALTLRERLPAIAVSAYARIEDRTEALRAGYTAYCAKPIDTRFLLDTVRATLSSAAL